MENTKIISNWQLILLVVCSRIMTAYTYLPILNTPPANQDVWISEILSAIYSVIFAIPILFIANKFKGINFTKTLELITGSFIGRILAILFFGFFIFRNILLITLSVIFVNSSVFPETPSYVIILFIMIPAMYIVYKGLETLGRISELIVPYVLLTILIFFILSINKIDLGLIKPILSDSNFISINLGAIYTALRFSDLIVFFVLGSYLKPNVSIFKSFGYSLLLVTLFNLIIIISTITVLGITIAQHASNPYFMFTREVNLYDFIQRVEALNVTAWMAAIIIQLSLYIYMSSMVLAQVFSAKTHNYFNIPISFLIFVVVIFVGINKETVVKYFISYKFFPYVVALYMFIIPLLLMIIYFFRRKKLQGAIEQAKNSA